MDRTPQEAPRAGAAACRSRGFMVDTLINNAGVGFTSRFSQSRAE
jgi:short-subunit dehydrogenase